MLHGQVTKHVIANWLLSLRLSAEKLIITQRTDANIYIALQITHILLLWLASHFVTFSRHIEIKNNPITIKY